MKTDYSGLIQYCVEKLVDEPEAVSVESRNDRSAAYLNVTVAPNDVGKVIGRNGRIVNALRSLASAVGSKTRQKVFVKVVSD
ncbi:MAG: KH domain-containing protein [Fimbriimonadales bacterium]